ncbi:MAG: tRNA lysidine(34) synthetase TilS [Acidimicrobiia bacterium]
MVESRRLTELADRATGLLDLPVAPYAVALSGGADSAALAFLMIRAGLSVRAIHVDHGLDASARLEAAAGEIVETLGIELETLHIQVPTGASPEARAREARYEAISTALSDGEWALTGHTLDDQAETVLMNLLRGTGPTGLRGIPSRNRNVARPMLAISRSETREIATLARLPYLDDPANADLRFRRNQIRLDVLPNLEARFNPRLSEALARTASVLGAEDDFLDGLVDPVTILGRGDRTAVAVGELLALPTVVANRLLRRLLVMARPPHGPQHRELEDVWEVVRGDRAQTILADGIEVKVDGPLLILGGGQGRTEPMERELSAGVNRLGRYELDVVESDGPCLAAPTGTAWAIFAPDAHLVARLDGRGALSVEANGRVAWVPWVSRKGVAWYEPGSNGYLSVFAREESGWISSP